MFLCDRCAGRLEHESFNDRPPLFEGLPVEGYCGLCNERTETRLRQWFICPICLNVVLSYPKGLAASKYVHEFWAREVRPEFPDLILEELDAVKLEPFIPGSRTKKNKGIVVQELDYRVVHVTGEHLFQIELKAGPASIDAMTEFQLDVNDFNDIASGCNRCSLPAYVFHVQINDDYLPPTRRSVATNLWWTDVWALAGARKDIRQRRDEDKRAGYYQPGVFRPRATFPDELRREGYRSLTARLRDAKIPLI